MGRSAPRAIGGEACAPESHRLGVWRVAARGCGFPDDSGIEEKRAGEGPGPAGGGPEQDRAWTRADDVNPEYCLALADRVTAETLSVRADIACVTYTCVCTVTIARKWYY